MLCMSARVTMALSNGRANLGAPSSREEVLARLLRKRAAAQQAGLSELERALRDQIRWSLPMRNPRDTAPE